MNYDERGKNAGACLTPANTEAKEPLNNIAMHLIDLLESSYSKTEMIDFKLFDGDLAVNPAEKTCEPRSLRMKLEQALNKAMSLDKKLEWMHMGL